MSQLQERASRAALGLVAKIDPERYYLPTEAARAAGRHPARIWEWMQRGLNRNGQKVLLPYTLHGGRRQILGADLIAYLRGEPPFHGGLAVEQSERTPAGRERDSQAARERLKAMGV